MALAGMERGDFVFKERGENGGVDKTQSETYIPRMIRTENHGTVFGSKETLGSGSRYDILGDWKENQEV